VGLLRNIKPASDFVSPHPIKRAAIELNYKIRGGVESGEGNVASRTNALLDFCNKIKDEL